ncbi:DUF6338 family protein [Halalkalicoccus subterraneus]|uniref:DUF6338 family protein n=1 Tax=Halalkalicoccus subterraneus TaxID=2675002 RepID=UPI000EFBD03F|nr:DUF6338 family protein [Halalkalicoccus subterraneus]
MVDVSALSTDLILLLLILLPGLLGLKLFLYRADRIGEYSRLDAIVYSAGISIFSLLILYGFYAGWLGRLPDFTDIQFSSLPFIIGLYLGHIVISAILGEVSSWVANRRFSNGRDKTRKEIWDYTFDDIYSDSRVRVFTSDNSEIEGTIVRAGQPVQARDLILASPYRLLNTGNNDKKTAISLGDYVYIHEEAVCYIGIFEDLNDDLDLEVLRELGYAPIEPRAAEKSDQKESDEELEEELRQELEGETNAEHSEGT